MHRNVIRFVGTWNGGGVCEEELDKGSSQKVQTFLKRKQIFFQLRSQTACGILVPRPGMGLTRNQTHAPSDESPES